MNNFETNHSKFLEEGKRVIETEIEALQSLLNSLDDSFNKAISLIMRVKGRVIVSGIGKSGLVARKIAATLSSTGTPAFFFHPTEAGHGDLGMVTRDDLIILLSYSGETEELLQLLPPPEEDWS